jgi:hypothetical protein
VGGSLVRLVRLLRRKGSGLVRKVVRTGSQGGSRLVRRHASATCDSGLQLRDALNAAASVKGVGGAVPADPIP